MNKYIQQWKVADVETVITRLIMHAIQDFYVLDNSIM